MTTKNAPPIPRRFTKKRSAWLWGSEYKVKPAVAQGFLGDGKRLLRFTPLNTRPDYYLIRVNSSFGSGVDEGYDEINDVIDALIEEFSEIERQRELLQEDLREQGIEPTNSNTDLNGNEDRLGFPVLSLNSGYGWGTMAVWDGKRWVE